MSAGASGSVSGAMSVALKEGGGRGAEGEAEGRASGAALAESALAGTTASEGGDGTVFGAHAKSWARPSAIEHARARRSNERKHSTEGRRHRHRAKCGRLARDAHARSDPGARRDRSSSATVVRRARPTAGSLRRTAVRHACRSGFTRNRTDAAPAPLDLHEGLLGVAWRGWDDREGTVGASAPLRFVTEPVARRPLRERHLPSRPRGGDAVQPPS